MKTNSELDQLNNVSYGVIITSHELNATSTHTLDKVSYGVIIMGQHGTGATPPATVNSMFFGMLLNWAN